MAKRLMSKKEKALGNDLFRQSLKDCSEPFVFCSPRIEASIQAGKIDELKLIEAAKSANARSNEWRDFGSFKLGNEEYVWGIRARRYEEKSGFFARLFDDFNMESFSVRDKKFSRKDNRSLCLAQRYEYLS